MDCNSSKQIFTNQVSRLLYNHMKWQSEELLSRSAGVWLKRYEYRWSSKSAAQKMSEGNNMLKWLNNSILKESAQRETRDHDTDKAQDEKFTTNWEVCNWKQKLKANVIS